MLRFTSAATTAADKAEDAPSQQLGAKVITTDGQVAIYTCAAVDIAAGAACRVLPDGTAALTGAGIACQSDYAIGKGQYGYVVYTLPVTAAS